MRVAANPLLLDPSWYLTTALVCVILPCAFSSVKLVKFRAGWQSFFSEFPEVEDWSLMHEEDLYNT